MAMKSFEKHIDKRSEVLVATNFCAEFQEQTEALQAKGFSPIMPPSVSPVTGQTYQWWHRTKSGNEESRRGVETQR